LTSQPLYRVYVTERDGGQTVADFGDRASRVRWGRQLNVSTLAEIEVSDDCLDIIRMCEPWAHELHIHRNGKEVWVGPVSQPVMRREGLSILFARDMLAWLQVRAVHNLIDHTTTGTGQTTPTAFAEAIIRDALAPEDSMGLLSLLTNMGECPDAMASDHKVDPALGDMSWDTGLATMFGTGIDIAAFGRRIMFGCAGACWGQQFEALVSDIDVQGDYALAQRGDLYASRWIVTGTTGSDGTSTVPVVGSAGGISPRYGLVERKVNSPTTGTASGVQAQAQRALTSQGPVPPFTLSEADENSLDPGRLRCDTDWNWAETPAGSCVRGDLTVGDRRVAVDLRLAKLDVEWSSTDERVTPTFSTIKAD
jgi:hypothetical protein